MDLTILPLPAFKDNYIWTLIDTEQKTALVVDPGDAAPVETFLEQQQLKLIGILVTHHHWDHTHGVMALQNKYGVPVFGPANEKVEGMTVPLQEKSEVMIDNFPLRFQVLDIPGHTAGHIAYYSPGMLFCGDTLFAAGCGRLFEGTAEQMLTSLQKMAALPDDTKIYCAHEYTSHNLRFAEMVEPGNRFIKERIKQVAELRRHQLASLPSILSEEKKTNPFLRCGARELIVNVEKYAGHSLNSPLEVFTYVRKWKDSF